MVGFALKVCHPSRSFGTFIVLDDWNVHFIVFFTCVMDKIYLWIFKTKMYPFFLLLNNRIWLVKLIIKIILWEKLGMAFLQ